MLRLMVWLSMDLVLAQLDFKTSRVLGVRPMCPSVRIPLLQHVPVQWPLPLVADLTLLAMHSVTLAAVLAVDV